MDTKEHELDMPTNLNQKHAIVGYGNEDVYAEFYDGGCMTCSYADIVGYYNNATYTIQNAIDNGWWKKHPKGFYCAYLPSSTKYHVIFFEEKTYATEKEYLDVIKEELKAGRPVMIHFAKPGSQWGHYVVAYKYVNGCIQDEIKPFANVWVLDPNNPDKNSSEGKLCTAYDACIASEQKYVDFIQTTSLAST